MEAATKTAEGPAGRATARDAVVRVPGFLTTARRDAWWIYPVLQAAGFLAFATYATWAAFQNAHYVHGPYLSPFYAPVLFADPGDAKGLEHAWFGETPAWYPEWLPYSPALLILPFPLLFRLTCYYYRKFLYRSFGGSPPGCAVGTLTGRRYRGEARGLLWLMNFHRFLLYVALVFIGLLAYDAAMAYRWPDGFGIGVGSLVLTANVVLLAGFTFGCNSLRHLVGGGVDCFSCERGGALRHGAWRGVTFFNRRHMLWAWISMFSVGLADAYVRLCSMGVVADPRIL
jgi:hypothetical protein